MLQLENVSKFFGSTTAVGNVSLTVEQGSFVGVIGRSGAGKSTLLRMINRLADPSEGHIFYSGEDVVGLKSRALRDWRRRCAMIFQQFNLVGRLDVMTNVLMGRLAHMPSWRAMPQIWSARDKAIAFAAMEQFDIAGLAPNRADQLSGGQQQRVAICRALVQEPDIILADEPIASLDPRNTRVVMEALRTINRDYGITVITNLHSLDTARSYCGRLIGMKAGRVVFDGTPAQLTDGIARELYGLEAGDVIDAAGTAMPGAAPQPARRALVT